jgi:peptide-methionine (S)-S-oxide reductase
VTRLHLAVPIALALLSPLTHAAEGIAIFASGCFWCTEADFEKVEGVTAAESGYIGGRVDNPRYEQVSAGGTGHIEAVRVHYDPAVVSYDELLAVYWRNVDPYTANAQFCDKGPQYRSALFPVDEAQRASAERTRDELAKRYPDRPAIVTEILPATRFWPAEDYHQAYYKKNPVRYRYYRRGCGRDQRLEELWGAAG